MGTIIDLIQLPDEGAMAARLLVYLKKIKETKEPQSVGKEIADELLVCKPERRSMKLEQIFIKVLDRYPDGVTIKDIAERLPEQTVQEDPNILMYHDISLGRV